ncbi:MAG: carboxy terminal-processing peptidase [Polyangiaceae bacterium]|nr:carboxy terminal-processing peptidase [Polyangiaceae bacterium]
MKRRPAIVLSLFALFGCSSPTSNSGTPTMQSSEVPTAPVAPPPVAGLEPLAQDPREPILAQAVASLLTEDHYVQRELDDSVSREAFPKYLEHLDGTKLFLLKEHVQVLERHINKMDDQLKAGDLVLARTGGALLAKRRTVISKVIAELLAKPFDLSESYKHETDSEKREYAATEEELTARWRAVLKLQVLERIEQLEELSDALAKKKPPEDGAPPKPIEELPTTFEGREAKARKELAVRYETRFTRWADLEPLEPAEQFLNAIAAVYDPHTTYLAPAEKENFDIQISGTLEGIGAALGEEDHYIVVRELIPGGASWQQGKLQAGDTILAVAQQGEPPVDITDMPIDKVVKMIRGPKGSVVTLTVKKVDGTVETISIKRDVVKIEASYARGAVLDLGKKQESVGYVYLPGFYGDTRTNSSKAPERNATDDVKKILETFQKKKLDAVVIDLRGNGGGLLGHARDITGLLIEKGPVVQAHGSDRKVEVLADTDPSVAFSGHVVVMVDRFSASASEILAGALQDYERAVIVGTGPTHGKGTVQALVDLDKVRGRPGDPLGVLKITIQQYFRIDGESTQWRGVVPDVILPDPAAYVDSGERSLFHSIPWSAIDPLPFKPYPNTWDPAKLAASSKTRVGAQTVFQKIDAFSKELKGRRDDTIVEIKRDDWLAERKKDKATIDALDPKLSEAKPRFEVLALAEAPAAGTGPDKGIKAQIDKWRENLARDPWLEESLFVIEDMRSSK